VLVGGAVALRAADPDHPTGPPRSAADTPRPSAAAASATLAELSRAVAARDPDAARALAPGGDGAAGDLLADLVANAADLRVSAFALRYVDEAGPVSATGAWSAVVDARWRLTGADPRGSHAEISMGLRVDGDRVAVTGVGGGGRRSPVWMTGRVQVQRSADVLVIDATGDAPAYERLARAAVRVVRRVLPRWRGDLVVEVPASAAALDRALGISEGDHAGVAAVTASADGSAWGPAHVFVNPEQLGDLGEVGAQVVMSHEATHVALGAERTAAPIWLVEGFADYVALRDVDLPVGGLARQVVREVRRDGVPEALPTAADFASAGSRAGAGYEAAWLACRVLAAAGGERTLVDFYRAVDAGEPVGTALRARYGFGEAALVRQWQGRLSDLAA
jgi:hypothetical protein